MNKKNNSVLVSVLVIIIIVLLGLIYYFAEVKPQQMVASQQVPASITSQPQTTVSQATPSSNTAGNYSGNGFTVNYPANLTFEKNVTSYGGVKEIGFTNSDPNDQAHEYQILYTVYIKDGISDNQTLEAYVKNNFVNFANLFPNGPQVPVTEKTVTVDGRTGFQFSYKGFAGGYGGTVYVTAVVHDGKAYVIQFGQTGTTTDYMNFVSSFSFQ